MIFLRAKPDYCSCCALGSNSLALPTQSPGEKGNREASKSHQEMQFVTALRGKKEEKGKKAEKDREEAGVIGQAYILGEKSKQSKAEGMQRVWR